MPTRRAVVHRLTADGRTLDNARRDIPAEVVAAAFAPFTEQACDTLADPRDTLL